MPVTLSNCLIFDCLFSVGNYNGYTELLRLDNYLTPTYAPIKFIKSLYVPVFACEVYLTCEALTLYSTLIISLIFCKLYKTL